MKHNASNAVSHNVTRTGCSAEPPSSLRKIAVAATVTERPTTTLPADCLLFETHGFEVTANIHHIVLERIPSLEKGVSYLSKELVGREYWDKSDREEHVNFGFIISLLVKAGHLPLRRGANNGRNWAQYQLL